MNKNKLLVFLLFLFLLVFNRTALPQYNDLNKPVIYITKFRPAYESKPYSILEESLNSVLMLVLTNDYQLVVLKDSISAGYNGTSKQKVQTNTQSTSQIRKEFFKGKNGFVIYGEYSFNNDVINVFPKLYDIKNEKYYTLQSVKIPDIKQRVNLSLFENLINTYKEKIWSLSKSNSKLLRVGITWADKGVRSITTSEKNRYRDYLIQTTKSADTIKLVNVLSWNTMDQFYSKDLNLSDIADSVNADLVYSLSFVKVSDYEIKVNIELYASEVRKVYNLPGFIFDIFDFNIENYLITDFYFLIKDLKTNQGLNFDPLEKRYLKSEDYEKLSLDLSESEKYLLSNFMINKVIELVPKSKSLYYYYFILGHNFLKLSQFERANYYFNKSLSFSSKSLRNENKPIPADTVFTPVIYEKGISHFTLGDYQIAADAFMNIEELNSKYKNGTLQFLIGLCNYYLDRYKQSLFFYEKAIDAGYTPLNDVFNNMKLIFDRSGDYSGAVEYFSKRVQDYTRDIFAQTYLCYSYYKMANKAFDNQNFVLADNYLDSIDKISINKYYADSIGIHEFSADYREIRRLTSLYLNNYEKAFITTQQGIENGEFDRLSIYKSNANELTFVKSPSNDNKRYEEIIRYYQLHSKAFPTDSLIDRVYNDLGYYYSLLGDLQNCTTNFEKAIKSNSNNLMYHLNKMEVDLAQKNYEKVFKGSEVIMDSVQLKAQVDTSLTNRTMFYFIIVNAEIASGQEYTTDIENFEKNLTIKNLTVNWDFTIYEKWLHEYTGFNKDIILRIYTELKSHIKTNK